MRLMTLAALTLLTASGCAAVGKAFIGVGALMLPGREVLTGLNTAEAEDVKFVSTADELAQLVRTRLPDAYWDPALVSARFGAPKDAAKALWDAVVCIDQFPHDRGRPSIGAPGSSSRTRSRTGSRRRA